MEIPLMWRRHFQGRTPLLYQASIRLLRGMVVATLVVGLLTAWVLNLSQEKSAWHEIRNATEYFSEGVKDRERRWEEAAVRFKSRIEFARLLEDPNPASRWTKLNAYLTSQNNGELFPALLITGLDGRIRFSFGLADEAVPATFASPPDMGWHFDTHSQTLYRYYVLHMWMGTEGMGRLVLLRPMDHGLLSQMATLSTNLFLRWKGQVIAASSGDQGKSAQLHPHAGLLDYDGMRFMQDILVWDETHPDSPELVIHREVKSLFDYWEITLGIAIALTALFSAQWASMGMWVFQTTRRITLVGDASRQFIDDGHPSPELKSLLASACRIRDDEINEVARSLESLATTVAQRNAERDAYEKTLRESEAKLREITSVLADGVYVQDAGGIVTFVNQEAERLLGWSAAELIGRDGHATFHYRRPDGSPITVETCPVHMTIRTGQSYRSHHDWLIRKDGSFLPVSIVSSPIVRDGQVAGTVAAFHDITPRLEAENALRESEERFRLISTSAMDAIIIVDPGEEISYWNPAAERVFGYKAEEVLGRNMHQVLPPPRHREDAHQGFRNFLASGTGPVVGRPVEITALRRNGEEFPVEMSISALRIKEQWYALGIIRDISERKKAEEQIRQLAYYDTLTNLPNRRLLLDRLNQALSQAKRHRRALAVMFLDLDRFKQINDTLGHDAGDHLLKEVAARLTACTRSGDTVSRQGGDEFVIILAEITRQEDAALVAEKIIDELAKPVSIKGQILQVTISIGIAIHEAAATDDAEELMKKADMAMYSAKEAGRNDYRFSME